MPNRSVLPGRFQVASRTGHVRTVLEAMAEKKDFYVPTDRIEPLDWLEDRVTEPGSLEGSADQLPVVAVGVDGSYESVEARPGMPSVRYGYIQTAAVMLRLDRYQELQSARFIDPVALYKAHRSALVEIDFPTSGAYIREGVGIVDSWRESVYESFRTKSVSLSEVEISLLEQLFEVHGSPGQPAQTLTIPRCPRPRCGQTNIEVPRTPVRCPGCGGFVYPTDILRIAEEVDDYSPNVTSLGRLMQVVEVLTLTAIIKLFWTRSRDLLTRMVFIADGPLAVFGTPAKLKTQILAYLQAMNHNGTMPYVCGVEKSGEFVEFAETLGSYVEDTLEPGTLITVDDFVIQKVKNNPELVDYGQETYFGRKFFYYTKDRSMLVLTVPPDKGHPYGQGVGQPEPTAYRSLPAILSAIDMTGSSMYRNAIVPIALAHNAAAYPVGVGTDVLRLAAREILGLNAGEGKSSQLESLRGLR